QKSWTREAALLEMIRLKLVRVFQSGMFGEIRVYKRARPQIALPERRRHGGDSGREISHSSTGDRARSG
ncbi:MAG: hypothetical protein AAB502_02700, partial [Chloroflexota bacterium]